MTEDKMKVALSFDDVLIEPNFSLIKSRQDVFTITPFLYETIFPLISANMDTVTGSVMVDALGEFGARGCLHRFMSIEDNLKEFKKSIYQSYVSIGLGKTELTRADALFSIGATHFVIDVAHGANMNVVEQSQNLREILRGNGVMIVGNFATSESLKAFMYHAQCAKPDAFKVGIGGGSACTTRIVTGCGKPTLQSILDCSKLNVPIIADGGIRSSGDFCKALAAGASAVMVGGMLAGTDETPGEMNNGYNKYRGSASEEAYDAHAKASAWRTAEGESFLVKAKGPVRPILQQLDAGLRSSMSYVGATNLKQYSELAHFNLITPNGLKESHAHGK